MLVVALDSIVYIVVYLPISITWDIIFAVKMDMSGHHLMNDFVEISTTTNGSLLHVNKDVTTFTFFGVR